MTTWGIGQIWLKELREKNTHQIARGGKYRQQNMTSGHPKPNTRTKNKLFCLNNLKLLRKQSHDIYGHLNLISRFIKIM